MGHTHVSAVYGSGVVLSRTGSPPVPQFAEIVSFAMSGSHLIRVFAQRSGGSSGGGAAAAGRKRRADVSTSASGGKRQVKI